MTAVDAPCHDAAADRPPRERRAPRVTRTRAEALEGAARCIVEGLRVSDSLPIEEAARRAMQAGGPSYEELLNLIRARRARLGLPEDEVER